MNAGERTVGLMLETPRRTSGRVTSIIVVALIVSVVLNVALAHKLKALTHARSVRSAELALQIGATVPPIAAVRLGGQQEVISYQLTDQPTVVYVFTPPCSWCARNIDNFKTLVDTQRGRYRIVGLSLSEEGLADYVEKNELKIPLFSGLSGETKQAYKLSGTPQTIVVSPEGRVLQDWVGAYVGEQKSQVEAFFHVTLPGLKELPKAEEKGKAAVQVN